MAASTPVLSMTVIMRQRLARIIKHGVRYRNLKPIRGGQSILVVQQQSMEFFSLIEVILEGCAYFCLSFAMFMICCLVLFTVYKVEVPVSDVNLSCFHVCHSSADKIYAGVCTMQGITITEFV